MQYNLKLIIKDYAKRKKLCFKNLVWRGTSNGCYKSCIASTDQHKKKKREQPSCTALITNKL